MKFTHGDIRDLVAWATGGFVVGCSYQLGNIWLKQRTNVQDLSPLTEALCDDAETFALFCQLQEYRDQDEISFRRAVDNADRLILLHVQLRKGIIQPSLTDRPTGFLHFKNTIKYLEKFFTSSKESSSARIPVEVHRLYLLLFNNLESHWNSILHLTHEVHENNM